MKYTAVMHSAGAYAGDPQFTSALEEAAVSTHAEMRKVKKAGGVLFDTYTEAADFCETENYPPGIEGLIPHVPGTFGKLTLEGRRVYLPGRTIFTASRDMAHLTKLQLEELRVLIAGLTHSGDYGYNASCEHCQIIQQWLNKE
jgi:hypothetical protein